MDNTVPSELQRYRLKTIAEMFDVHPVTVSRWIAAGLPAENVGSVARPDWRLKPADVAQWLKGRND